MFAAQKNDSQSVRCCGVGFAHNFSDWLRQTGVDKHLSCSDSHIVRREQTTPVPHRLLSGRQVALVCPATPSVHRAFASLT
jgi:hypothetical protein